MFFGRGWEKVRRHFQPVLNCRKGIYEGEGQKRFPPMEKALPGSIMGDEGGGAGWGE